MWPPYSAFTVGFMGTITHCYSSSVLNSTSHKISLQFTRTIYFVHGGIRHCHWRINPGGGGSPACPKWFILYLLIESFIGFLFTDRRIMIGAADYRTEKNNNNNNKESLVHMSAFSVWFLKFSRPQ